MKVFSLYLAALAVGINVTGNVFANSAAGLEQIAEARAERLCGVNKTYCR